MTVRVAAIALAQIAMAMTMVRTSATGHAQNIEMTPALAKVSLARRLAAVPVAKGVTFTDVSIAWWRAHPSLDEDNQKLAKLLREK